MILPQIKNITNIIGVVLIVISGSFVMGYQLVIITILSSNINAYNSFSSNSQYQLALITTSLPIGGILGSFYLNKWFNTFHQQIGMIIIDILFIILFFIQISSLSFIVLIITRFTLGFLLALSSGIIPIYLTSIAPIQYNGIIGTSNQLFITIGIAVAYSMGFTSLSNYYIQKIVIGFPIIFCIIRIIGLLWVFPFNTIQRHFQNGQINILQQYTQFIYKNTTVPQIRSLKYSQQTVKQRKKQISKSTKKCKLNRITVLIIVISISNQMSGINAILFYAQQLFETVSKPQQVPYNVFNLGIFQIIMTLLCGLVIDYWGRRKLMLIGLFIIILSLISIFIIKNQNNLQLQYLLIYFIFIHIFGFSISLGPITMVYISQLQSNIEIAIIVLWLGTVIVSFISPLLISHFGVGQTFLFYGIISTVCLIYLYFQMIETKGKNRNEIQMQFANQIVDEEQTGLTL